MPWGPSEKAAAEFFAKLASIPDWQTVSIGDRVALISAMDRVLPEAMAATSELSSDAIPLIVDDTLLLAHKEARRRIAKLLDEGQCFIPTEDRIARLKTAG